MLENTGLTGNVSCGNHGATTCADCPQGNGASWCHGDCRWVDADSSQVSFVFNDYALVHRKQLLKIL